MRKSRIYQYCIIAIIMLNLTACVTWSRIKTPQMNGPQGRYHVTVPMCWIHAAFIKDGICISKDGPSMNWIEVKHIQKNQGFPLTKVIMREDHLITEVAEYYLAELKEKYKGVTVNHLITEPARIEGRTGFKVHLELINEKGLIFDVLAYGLMDDTDFYQLLYRAPRIYYFEKEIEAFEQLVASFRIGPGEALSNPKPH